MNRDPDSHKGQNGKVTILGGSKDYAGAPALSGRAALRSGCDLVKIVTSEAASSTVASYSENLIVREYKGDYLSSLDSGIVEALDWSDAAVVGPGLSQPDFEVLKQIFRKANTSWIVDADAIEPATEIGLLDSVFTPHKSEKNHIIDKYGSIGSFVDETESTVVVKGRNDKIFSSDRKDTIGAGHPGMTAGGTGDVLTGVLAGFISQGMNKHEAAVKAATVNGAAGEKAAEKYRSCLLATDLLDLLPEQIYNFSD